MTTTGQTLCQIMEIIAAQMVMKFTHISKNKLQEGIMIKTTTINYWKKQKCIKYQSSLFFVHTDEMSEQTFQALQPRFSIPQQLAAKRLNILRSKIYGEKYSNKKYINLCSLITFLCNQMSTRK